MVKELPVNVEPLQGFAGLFDEPKKLLSCTKYSKRTMHSPLSEIMDHKKSNLEDENDDTLDLSLADGENFK